MNHTHPLLGAAQEVVHVFGIIKRHAHPFSSLIPLAVSIESKPRIYRIFLNFLQDSENIRVRLQALENQIIVWKNIATVFLQALVLKKSLDELVIIDNPLHTIETLGTVIVLQRYRLFRVFLCLRETQGKSYLDLESPRLLDDRPLSSHQYRMA